MSEITGPISIEISEDEIESLKDGVTITRELDTDLDGTTELQIVWKTVYESEGAAELFNEISSCFE